MAALVEHHSFLQDILNRQAERRSLIDPSSSSTSAPAPQPQLSILQQARDYTRTSSAVPRPKPSSEAKSEAGPSKSNVVNYVAEEETIRNDLPGWFGTSGEFGSNYILGAKDEEICEEYPALKKLMNLKQTHVESHSHPPLYLPLTLAPSPSASSTSSSSPTQIPPSPSSVNPTDILKAVGITNKFDVILVHPLSSWEATSSLPIRQISADPSFVFLWVGKSDHEGLERGRECFAKWGFRRAEDIVWVKINRNKRNGNQNAIEKVDNVGKGHEEEVDGVKDNGSNQDQDMDGDGALDQADQDRPTVGGGPSRIPMSNGAGPSAENGALFASQKEHCLMGIRGTVRRSTDMRFVHCNVDTDVMVWQEDEDAEDEEDNQTGQTNTVEAETTRGEEADPASTRIRPRSHLPPYLYTLIENFCLGTRRLELFSPSPSTSLRKGWVTSSLHPLSNDDPDQHQHQPSEQDKVQLYNPATYPTLVPQSDGRPILPYSSEIDALRPKSPQRRPRNLPPTGSGSGSGQGMSPGITSSHTGGRPGSAASASGSGGYRPNSFQNRNQHQYQNQNQIQVQQGYHQQPQPQLPAQGNGAQGFNPMFGGQGQGQMSMPMGGGGYPMEMGMGGMGMGMGMGMNPAMGMGMPLMGGMDIGMGMGMGMMNPMMMGMPQMSMGMPQMGMGVGMNQHQFGQQGFNPGVGGGMGMGMGMGMGVNGGQPGFDADGSGSSGYVNLNQAQGQGGMGWLGQAQGGGNWQ
ncbi:hypothetical protein IAT40_006016 [Kwoniella sp. CBS 6097]